MSPLERPMNSWRTTILDSLGLLALVGCFWLLMVSIGAC